MSIHTRHMGPSPMADDPELVFMVALGDVREVSYYLCNNTVTWGTFYNAVMAVRSWRMLCVLMKSHLINHCMGRIFWDAVHAAQETGRWILPRLLTNHPHVKPTALGEHALSFAVLTEKELVVRAVLADMGPGESREEAIELCHEKGLTQFIPLLSAPHMDTEPRAMVTDPSNA